MQKFLFLNEWHKNSAMNGLLSRQKMAEKNLVGAHQYAQAK